MASSSCRPVGITWEYDRVELIADGIVHALGTSLGVGWGDRDRLKLAGRRNSAKLTQIPTVILGVIAQN
jgi:hypothetical protein